MNQAASVTITAETIANARADIQRLNGELAELRNEEQRCQIRRSRLEAERVRVLAFIETWELAQRFNTPSGEPRFRIEPLDPAQPNGVKVVTVSSAPVDPAPAGAPTIRETVVAALGEAAEHGRGLKARALIKAVRQKGLPEVNPRSLWSSVCRMTRDGELQRGPTGIYRLANGHGG